MRKPFYVCLALLCLSLLLNGWLMRRHGTKAQVADTVRVTLVDTVTYRVPVARDSVVVRYVTVRLAVADTASTARSDSADVVLPVELKSYTDDSTYTAWVSGWRPCLDSIRVYPRREVVTVTQAVPRRPRLAVGLTGGVGYGVISRRPDVFVGVGVTWQLTK